MYEAVLQSAGPRLETPQSPPWWQQTEEAVCRVGGITCNAEGFAGEMGAVDVLEGEEETPTIFSAALTIRVKGLAAGRVAGAIPHSDTARCLLCRSWAALLSAVALIFHTLKLFYFHT